MLSELGNQTCDTVNNEMHGVVSFDMAQLLYTMSYALEIGWNINDGDMIYQVKDVN